MPPVPRVGLQLYDVPALVALAETVVLVPLHNGVRLADAVMVGKPFTFTVVVAVFLHPFASVPVTL
jgi:hypothetical protein